MSLGAPTGQGGDANDVSFRSDRGQEDQTGQQRLSPARWVHGEHPERSRRRLGEEPPLITAELRTAPIELTRNSPLALPIARLDRGPARIGGVH
jgi:hypothetical protein